MITGSIVALVTPMQPDGSIDWTALERLLEHHVAAGTKALGVTGTTGESATLTVPEHCDVIRFSVAQAAGRIPVIAGTGSNSTHEAIELTVAAAEAGADASLLVTPYYNRPTQEGLYQHFVTVAAAVNLPIILYNVPGRTAVDLSNDTVLRLTDVDNIVGLKDATGNVERGADLIARAPDSFAVYSGDDPTALELMKRGGKGNVSVTANVAAEVMAKMCDLALAGDFDAATALDERMRALHQALFVEANPIPVKWALLEQGLISSGIRLPLVPLSEEYHDAVRDALEKLNA
ncbi:dihydrodipicolinate synthase [Luminiphilus syltensis NOR5-1B]|uniref:4-hydroxy-tetrahydrodipicolinate synthase n=1 Tax=Luminiphilus syltensis NOR5-1B TaxID=565045 RepID=B8KQB5_9GAMM|nr:4-hydroxy-tetrahydrodipicolinate synthase [Luminiphilus syltensis]EED34458.1 dihydrodipicolinate synthase [Luminiphilus syltensis NOR5-1B]